MRSTGFVGPADEVMQHWLARTRNRAEALASRPDIITDSFYERSFSMSRKFSPSCRYGLAKRHIAEDSFYRKNKRFDVVAFPDGDSLVRSGLPIDRMFMSASDGNGGVKKSSAVNIALDEYDEYLEFVPHATDIDFMAEALFSPSVTTIGDFKKYASGMILSAVRKSPSLSQWLWGASASAVLEALAGCAFRIWFSEIKTPKKDPEIPKLTPVYAVLIKDFVRVLSGDVNAVFFSKARSACMDPDEKECLKFYASVFPESPRRVLAAFLKEASRDINMSICRNGGPGIAMYMAGSADTIMLRTGNSGNMDCFIPWVVRTSSLFPDTIFYALALEKWTGQQLEAFGRAIENSDSGSLVIWTAAYGARIPDFLLKNDVITRDDYEDDGFCFKAVRPESAETYLRSSGIRIPGSEQIAGIEGADGKTLLYEIGFVSKELGESISRNRKDPFAGTQVNMPKESIPVLSPYMILPEDTIERARYKTLRALKYKPEEINKAVLISDAVPDFYGWIAEAMENRAKVPKLNYDELKKKRNGKSNL